MKNTIILLTFICCLLSHAVDAQENKGFTAMVPKPGTGFDLRHLIESLVGQGIVLKNYSVTRANAPDAFGFFEDKSAKLGMKNGLLMTSGGINLLTAANTSAGFSRNNWHSSYDVRGKGFSEETYPELSRLLKGQPPTYDNCVIELDIVPTSDTLSFNYVFGSEEYDEYVGSAFNDVFGFFISGKGIAGEKNLAVIPGTGIPVSINSINDGNSGVPGSTSSNPSFYARNTDGHIAIEYDGFTRLMEIRQPVIAYETYHLKIAIADVSDDALDSGVFIEGQSFISYEKSYNVLFDPNSSEIDQGYKTMLKDFATLYKNRPDASQGKILVTGHTDGDGTEEYNEALSAKRTSEVYAYLKNQGLASSDMELISKGENMPRADNYNDEGKQLNRRVEIKICGSLDKYNNAKTNDLKGSGVEKTTIRDNYPNPFDNSTTIRTYVTSETKEAYISITDIKGNTLKTIYLLERGNTEVYFGAENLASGYYMATLVSDGTTAGSIKLVVQK